MAISNKGIVNLKLKLKRILPFFILAFLLLVQASYSAPFLVCDPYDGTGSVTSIEIRYAPPEQNVVVVEGTYSVSGGHIVLLDLTDQYISNPAYFRARWLVDGSWSNWSDTGVSKGRGGIQPSKGTGSIAPSKGTGTISPYYDDILFILYDEPNYLDLLFSPIYGITNLTNTRMK